MTPIRESVMPLNQLMIDDGPHVMDGLRMSALDGNKEIEAFISRKVLDVWTESIEHSGANQSLFRRQYNVVGKDNHAAIQRIVERKYNASLTSGQERQFVEVLFADIVESGETLDLSGLIREKLPPSFHLLS
jgi:hypothetical protein